MGGTGLVFNGLRNHGYLGNFGIAPQAGITAVGGTVTTYPTTPRTNLIANPNMELNTTGWVGTTGTADLDLTSAYIGTKSAKFLTSTNTGFTISYDIANTGQIQSGTHTFSVYIKTPSFGGYTYVSGYDAFGNPIYTYVPQKQVSAKMTYYVGGTFYYVTSPTAVVTGSWQRVSVTQTFSNIPTSVVLSIIFSNMSGTSESINVDAALLEASSSAGTYFDGSTTDYTWTGTANASTSTSKIYKVHTFTSSGTFTVLAHGATYNDANILIVAGGGGGAEYGGGGGAGGLLTALASPTAQSYPIVVGAGGLGRTWPNKGYNGGDSSAFGQTAIGGGGGGPDYGNGDSNGANGGSGGGGMENANYSAVGGTGVAGQGYAGGAGTYTGTAKGRTGGGGGGAGGVGAANTAGGAGGPGVSSSITGTSITYAVGGSASGSGGVPNTGYGGGGAMTGGDAGGNGVVIIRYRTA